MVKARKKTWNTKAELLPNELCVVSVDSKEELIENEHAVNELVAQSSMVYLRFPTQILEELSTDFLSKLQCRGIILVDTSVDKRFDFKQERIRALNPELELSLELKLERIGTDIRELLYQTATLGISFFTINSTQGFNDEEVRLLAEAFRYLRGRKIHDIKIYFSFDDLRQDEWNAKTRNTYSGLEEVHIDVSNRCTHSCEFCGLYSPSIQKEVKEQNGGKLPQGWLEVMKQEIETEQCLKLIRALPWTVKRVQFGGYGDPLMHPNAIDFIWEARSRGFEVEILSNMEYLNIDKIERLQRIGSKKLTDLHFIANVSGGTPASYQRTRPKQNEKSFQKVVENLKLISKLKEQNRGLGLHYTLMCIVNRLNLEFLDDMIDLALEVGGKRVWFRPMEIHTEGHRALVPSREDIQKLSPTLKRVLKKADFHGIIIQDREIIETMIEQVQTRED
jgi:MoaA/NifB/PqqE/SkfB family radical SAM enzyme